MNKCPRCENENLVENQKFCQICGLKLEDLNISKEEAIEFLKMFKEKSEDKIFHNPIEAQIANRLIKALELAIDALEKTDAEVPVQEKLKPKSTIDYGSGKFKSIKLYNNQEDFNKGLSPLKEEVGLFLTPDVLRLNNISSIDEIYMVGLLEDK